MNSKEQLLNPVPAAAMAVMTTSITELTPADTVPSAGTLITPSEVDTALLTAVKPTQHSHDFDATLCKFPHSLDIC